MSLIDKYSDESWKHAVKRAAELRLKTPWYKVLLCTMGGHITTTYFKMGEFGGYRAKGCHKCGMFKPI